MPLPFILAGVGKVLLGQTIQAAIVKATEKVAEDRRVPEMKKADVAPVATAMIKELSEDPTFINATNSEPAYQSRVAWGSVVSALGVLIPLISSLFGWDLDQARVVEIGSAVITLGGAGYALYGRFMPGLKPLFSRKGT